MELRNVRRSFGGVEVLRGISLHVPAGSFTSLLGPSGCGKSTTLRIMAGLDRPDSGDVLMDGVDVSRRSATERNIAMVFQSYALYPHLTVAQNMALPLTMRELSRWQRLPLVGGLSGAARQRQRTIQERVAAMAAMLDLTELLGRKPSQLSGGQQQRVAVGRALIREPSVFLLDEPLSNLDARLRTQMRGELRALHKRTGRSFVYVTHDQTEAISMSDRVALMLDGRIAQIGPPRTLYEAPQSQAVAAFIGDHPINLVPVSLAPGQASGAFARCRPVGLAAPRAVVIGLRPEHLCLDPAGPLEGHLVGAEYLGAETVLTLKIAEGFEIRAVAPGTFTSPAPNAALRLGFAPEHVHVFDADGGERLDLSLERGAA